MHIALLLFDGMTALDAVGPLEVLARVPGVRMSLVAKRPGIQRCGAGSAGLGLEATTGSDGGAPKPRMGLARRVGAATLASSTAFSKCSSVMPRSS